MKLGVVTNLVANLPLPQALEYFKGLGIQMEDEPSGIINAIRIAKATLRSVRQNMVFAIGMKVILIVLAFFGYVTMQNAILADMAVMVINILNSFWMMKFPEH